MVQGEETMALNQNRPRKGGLQMKNDRHPVVSQAVLLGSILSLLLQAAAPIRPPDTHANHL
jgi:hypothetical protein